MTDHEILARERLIQLNTIRLDRIKAEQERLARRAHLIITVSTAILMLATLYF